MSETAGNQRGFAGMRGFTLIEMAIVLLIIALLAAAVTRYALAINDSNNIAALGATLDVIDTAMLNFRNENNRLPCPSVISSAENTSAFGTEVETLADGACTGASYSNSGTDPYASDTNYTAYNGGTSNIQSMVVAGAVPTKALKIADKYAYDPWGRKILYVVDRRYTAAGAFSSYTITNSGSATAPGVIVVTNVVTTSASNTLANALTYKGVYALVSFGENGHGGYVRNLNNTAVVFNASSTNTDEQQNCHCNSSAAATTFDREFVQNPKNYNTGTSYTEFDDTVRFKTRPELASPSELQ